MTMPEGAQRSEDGHYWWDGSQWQLVPQDQSGQAPAADSSAAAAPQLSEGQVADMMNSAEQAASEA
jgi:hypothetical protein